jgi:hypothetical protein
MAAVDHERPGARNVVGLAPVQGGAATRAVRRRLRRKRPRQRELVAIVTADQRPHALPAEPPERGLRPETPPDLVRLERRLGGDHHHDQADEGEQGDTQLEAGEIGQLHVGDDHAEQVDLHHRPGPEQLGGPEHRGDLPRHAAEPGTLNPNHPQLLAQHGRRLALTRDRDEGIARVRQAIERSRNPAGRLLCTVACAVRSEADRQEARAI